MIDMLLALGLILNVQDEVTLPCVDDCVAEQLPEEVIGRQITDENGIEWLVVGLDSDGNQILVMVFPIEMVGEPLYIEAETDQVDDQLAETGGFNQGLAAISVSLLTLGSVLRRLGRRN